MKAKAERWIRAHKTLFIVLIILACLTILGAVIVVLNWDAIKSLLKTARPDVQNLGKAAAVAVQSAPACLPDDITNNLTGEMLTPKALGCIVGCSPQQINKKLVAAKLQEKAPGDGWIMTETGRMLGKTTGKITKYDHPFHNIEWDKKVLEVIFTPEELAAKIAEKERISKISSTW